MTLPAQKDVVMFWHFAYRFNLWAEGKPDAEYYLIRQVKKLKLGKTEEEDLIHSRLQLVANAEPFVSSLMNHFPRCVQQPRDETPKQTKAYVKEQEDKANFYDSGYKPIDTEGVGPTEIVPF